MNKQEPAASAEFFLAGGSPQAGCELGGPSAGKSPPRRPEAPQGRSRGPPLKSRGAPKKNGAHANKNCSRIWAGNQIRRPSVWRVRTPQWERVYPLPRERFTSPLPLSTGPPPAGSAENNQKSRTLGPKTAQNDQTRQKVSTQGGFSFGLF